MYSIWVKSTTNQLFKIQETMKFFSEEEEKDYFEPHVTLVTNLQSENFALDIFDKITKHKFDIIFDGIQEGKTYFQRLFLTASDNSNFQILINNIEGWPSLWVPHLSLYYGNELPKSYSQETLHNLLPITVTFDTLELYRTGPLVSEWNKISSLILN